MRDQARKRPTIGFLSTWAIYEGTNLDWYAHTFLRGVCAAARDHACNLLLGCGLGLPNGPRESRTAWATPGTGINFIPVGTWNADGLIIIPDNLSEAQSAYVQDVIRAGYPVIATTAEQPWPLVAIDNAGGIQQALAHLFEHGHRQIAFIAGNAGRGGDSAERLQAYRDGLQAAGIAADPRLIAYGELCYSGGVAAMRRILASRAPFSALLASNDQSCIGALKVLRAAGRRIPEDVAVIGFDDSLEARAHSPPLTTVRHPAFALGYQAVLALLDAIAGRQPGAVQARIPTRLIVRQSCGCRPARSRPLPIAAEADRGDPQRDLARAMAEAALGETRYCSLGELEVECLALVRAIAQTLHSGESAAFTEALQGLLHWIEQRDEDGAAWHAGLSVLRQNLQTLAPGATTAQVAEAVAGIDDARVAVSEYAQRQANRALLQRQQMTNRLGLMTAQLLSALDVSESEHILARHLSELEIDHVVVATYAPQDDDPFAHSAVAITAGLPAQQIRRRFSTRQFPPPGLYPREGTVQLAVLPLVIDDETTGFVAMSAGNLETCGAIVHHLAAALRTSRLYLDALAGRRQAEEASRLKSRFLAMVSHELRTPLSLIVGLSDMVLREHGDMLRHFGAARRDIDHIHASAQQLGRLIGDVLDLASSEAGQLHLLREQLDLAELLRGLAALGEQMAHDRGLIWRLCLPAQGPLVFGDRTRLRQVVLNLISNAVKFTPSGTVAVELSERDGQALVSVSDTGVGIAAAEHELIFNEFYRADQAQRSGYGGLGLGLAVCKQLIARHHGGLGLRSPGDLGGATFFFSLPILAEGLALPVRAARDGELREPGHILAPGGAEPSQVPAYGQPERQVVLVVDDDSRVLDLHCRLLEQTGRAALRACNGHEALAVLEHVRPDLILLDLMMPQMDGFATLDALRAGQATRGIPVVVMTAQSLSAGEIERSSQGVAALLNKGLFNATEMLDRVEHVLAHQHQLAGPTQRLVRRAMAFLHAHYAEPLRREQIAGHVGVSADYLADCFRQELGVTPTTYLQRYRIYQARELLANSDLAIAAVALAVGFSESAHFTRAFHREVGISPRAFRRGRQHS